MGASHNVEVPLFNALSREVDIKGVFRYANEYIIYSKHKLNIFYHFKICFSYGDALSLIASGQVNLMPLITHNFKIEQSLEAFKTAETRTEDSIKVMIHCNEDIL